MITLPPTELNLLYGCTHLRTGFQISWSLVETGKAVTKHTLGATETYPWWLMGLRWSYMRPSKLIVDLICFQFIAMLKKTKDVPLHATKALGGRGDIAPTHSRLRHYMGLSDQHRPGHTLAPGKGPQVPTVQEAGWAPESVWTHRLEEKSIHLCRG
jgi:hypothetical protein